MPFQPVPNTAQVDVLMQVDSQTVENVYHVRKDTPWSSSELDSLLTLFSNWMVVYFLDNVSNQLTFNNLEAKDLTTSSGFVANLPIIPPVTGNIDAEPMPNEVSICLSARTGRAGRSFRGRTFVPAIPRTVVALNVITTGYATDLLTAQNQLSTELNAEGWALVVVSRVQGGVTLATAETTAVTEYILVDRGVDSMKSRKPGVGG